MQIARNIATGWAVFLVRILTTLLLTPFILRSLGIDDYGLWALIISIAALLELVDFGTSNGLRRYYSQAIGRRDEHLMQSYLNASATIFAGLAMLIVVVTALIIAIGPQLVDIADERTADFRLVMFLLGLRAAVIFLLKPFGGVISAHERFDVIYGIQLIGEVLRVVLLITVLKAGMGIIGLAVATLCTAIGANLFEYVVAQKMFGPLRPKIKFERSTYVATLFSYSGITVVISVCDYLRGNLNNVMVSAFTDLRSVAYYAIAFQLVTYMVQLLRVVTATFIPRFSRLQGEGDESEIRRQVIMGARMSTSILTFMLVVVWFAANPFLQIWLDESFEISYRILQIMVPAIALGYGMSVLTSYLYATSQHGVYARISVVEVVVDVAVSAWLLSMIGVFGAAWGTLAAVLLVRVVWLINAACRRMNLAPMDFVVQSYSRSLLFAILYVPAAYFAIHAAAVADPQGWLGLLVLLMLLGVVGLPLALLVILTHEERLQAWAFARRWMDRRAA